MWVLQGFNLTKQQEEWERSKQSQEMSASSHHLSESLAPEILWKVLTCVLHRNLSSPLTHGIIWKCIIAFQAPSLETLWNLSSSAIARNSSLTKKPSNHQHTFQWNYVYSSSVWTLVWNCKSWKWSGKFGSVLKVWSLISRLVFIL